MSRDLARELYLSYRSRLRKNKNTKDEVLRNRIDDPTAIADVINELIGQKEWQQGIAEGTLFTDWDSLVGPEIASHATPLTLVDGRLTIQTTSTAWATQLNLISHQLLQTITTQAAGALVEELKIIGPHAPSWKKGVRTIRGAKGPRDTYN
ncbi:MAG: DciA family protein [Actinomycetes bacterium]|jgi:predicted nucleic acid-binding Zn ribbon protein